MVPFYILAILNLKVEELRTKSVFAVDKSSLKLGAVGDPSNDNKFIVAYSGQRNDKARVIATVPWLNVKPDNLDFLKPGDAEIVVNITPAASVLPIKTFASGVPSRFI